MSSIRTPGVPLQTNAFPLTRNCWSSKFMGVFLQICPDHDDFSPAQVTSVLRVTSTAPADVGGRKTRNSFSFVCSVCLQLFRPKLFSLLFRSHFGRWRQSWFLAGLAEAREAATGRWITYVLRYTIYWRSGGANHKSMGSVKIWILWRLFRRLTASGRVSW